MSDTVKLIIDISEELYQMCKSCLGDADCIESAIANGTPLDDVKAELEQIKSHSARFRTSDGSVVYADNIGKESEDEE